MKKMIFYILGALFFILGIVGLILPIVPQVPFFLLSFICFVRCSPRIKKWFVSTKMYQKYLREMVEKKGTTRKNKIIYVLSFTITSGIGVFLFRDNLPAIITILVLWLAYFIYIAIILKTL